MRPFRLVRLSMMLALLGTAASSAACLPAAAPAGLAAGVAHLHLNSPSFSRAVDVQVWYPAQAKVLQRPVFYTSTYWGLAAPNVPSRTGSRYPLVLLSHGWRGTRFDLSWIAEALARRGYVVASLDSPDVDAKTFETAQAPKIWARAALLRQLIDRIGTDAKLGAITDSDHVAVIGHSNGGSTAMMLGGAQLDPARFASLFPESAPVISGPWSDPRVRAIVGLNPGTGPAFSPAGLANIKVPTLIVSGTGDHVAPEATNARLYASSIAQAEWLRIPGADHYTFMDICSPWGLLRGFSTCREEQQTVDRQAVHDTSLARIESFLARVLPSPLTLAG